MVEKHEARDAEVRLLLHRLNETLANSIRGIRASAAAAGSLRSGGTLKKLARDIRESLENTSSDLIQAHIGAGDDEEHIAREVRQALEPIGRSAWTEATKNLNLESAVAVVTPQLDQFFDSIRDRVIVAAAKYTGARSLEGEPEILRIERQLRDPLIGDGVLAEGNSGVASRNIRSAFRAMGVRIAPGDRYDSELRDAVRGFQLEHGHANVDGIFGPGTRRLLAETLYKKLGPSALAILAEVPSQSMAAPVVFISYAWSDAGKVDKIDQWLRDRGVSIYRDTRDFRPGQQLPDAIKDAIVKADKVLAVYSVNSRERDWPRFELGFAEQREASVGSTDFIIYLILDGTSLPKHDPNRIAVHAQGRSVKQVGEELLRGIVGGKGDPPRIEFDEDAPL